MNVLPPQTMVSGKLLMTDIFSSEQLRQFAAESTRIRADSGGVRHSPPDLRRTSGEFARNYFSRKAGGSAVEGLSPREKPRFLMFEVY